VLLAIAAFVTTLGIGATPAAVPAPNPVQPALPGPAANLVDRSLALEALDEAEAARREAAGRARFMAEMSHELRTPLNAIIGFSDSMKEGVFGPLPERYADYAGLINQSGKHLLDLISDLLDLSKVEAGRYRIEAGPVDLADIANEAVAMGAAVAAPNDVHLRLEAVGPVAATADRRAVLQMVLNLVSNAVKFTPAGGLVTVRALALSDGPRLEVQDTGVGMTADQLARIGQPYASSTEGLSGQRGTGLGLALVQRLAALQGGSLAIDSQPGAGTMAVVKLPAATETAPAASPEAADPTATEPVR
jgi:cell cycle sensor histidine kinase DivJ